jgi:nucleotide-binding universal stress UspA family protein
MYRKILLCYDATAEGRRALREGAYIAAAMKCEAHLLAICRNLLSGTTPEGVTPALMDCQDQNARALLDEGVQKLRELGIQAAGSLVTGDPLAVIPQVARDLAVDLIVVGHESRGRLARWWSDSREQTLLDRLSCSILVATKRFE